MMPWLAIPCHRKSTHKKLTRRFQVVKVEEPEEEQAVIMVRGITEVLENHHGVLILSEAVDSAVRLSHRYIPSRQLPDKAVSLIDTACARVAISQVAVPAVVEDTRKLIENRESEKASKEADRALGTADEARIVELDQELVGLREKLAEYEAEWVKEAEAKGLKNAGAVLQEFRAEIAKVK